MKKTDYSRPHNKPGHNPRRSQNRTDRPTGGPNRSHASNAQAVRLWMTTPSTLTSHIPMLNKRDPNAKKPDSNGNGSYSHKNRGKQNQRYDKPRQEMNGGYQSHKNRHASKPRHEPQDTMQSAQSTGPAPEAQTAESKALASKIDAFEMFCAYHLGIGPNKEYKLSNINEIAKRFNMAPAMVRQVVKELGMDAEALLDRDFDMSLAQLDIQVAPEGIDRMELAKGIYEDFLQSPVKKRDWKKILEDDRLENMKMFGKN